MAPDYETKPFGMLGELLAGGKPAKMERAKSSPPGRFGLDYETKPFGTLGELLDADEVAKLE